MNFIDSLDPAMAAALEPLPPMLDGDLSLLENRQNTSNFLAKVADMLPPFAPSPDIEIENQMIKGPEGAPDILVRVYQPKRPHDKSIPALLWLHGGGFFLGSVYMDDELCQRYALQIGCVIVSVEYRLIPEHPYPAATEDCYAALTWVANSADRLRIDPHRIAVGGVSAGGCLAAAVALMARDRGGPALALQYLNIPVLDDRLDTPSSHLVSDKRIWNRDIAVKSWRAYLGDRHKEPPAYAAPARATDLSGLPQTYMIVAEQDLLRDEGIAYAQRLMQAGVNTELHVFSGTFHGAAILAPQTDMVQRQMAEEVAVLKQALTG